VAVSPGCGSKTGDRFETKKGTMKLIKLIPAVAFAIALMALPAVADDHKQAGCCKKAAKDSKTCDHPCCVTAAKSGKECEKCGGSGDIPKKDDKTPEKKPS
jgi:hypothetical protein